MEPFLGDVQDVTYKISAIWLFRKVGNWRASAESACLSFISYCINLSRPVLHQRTQKSARAREHSHSNAPSPKKTAVRLNVFSW